MDIPFPFAGAQFPCFALDDDFTVSQTNPAAEALQLPADVFRRMLSEDDAARLRRGLPLQLPWNRLPGMVCTLNLLPLAEGYAALLQPVTPHTNGYAAALEKMMEHMSGVFAALPSVQYFLEDDRQGASMLDYTVRQCYRIMRAINDQLWSVRLSEGYQPLLEEMDLEAVLRTLCQAITTALPTARLAYKSDGVTVPVKADRALLELAVTHLLNNSLTFGDGGQVTITLQKRGKRAIVHVTDDGKGLQPQVAAHAFDAFYSADPYCDTDNLPGQGLGLFLVQQGLQAMGGECALESEFGRGTRFSFMLPQTEDAARLVHADLMEYLMDRQSCVYLQFCPLGARIGP